jgi:S1-C subfamily serine protease
VKAQELAQRFPMLPPEWNLTSSGLPYDSVYALAQSPLVVLKISGGCSQALALGNSDAVQVGDSVYAVGNPQGLEGTFSQGIISSVRELGSKKLLQITAPISPGSSGGPVLNEKGEVIGVSVATFRERPEPELRRSIDVTERIARQVWSSNATRTGERSKIGYSRCWSARQRWRSRGKVYLES